MYYPSWRYHSEKDACIVRSAEEDAALGEGWVHSPIEVVKVKPARPPIKVEVINPIVAPEPTKPKPRKPKVKSEVQA